MNLLFLISCGSYEPGDAPTSANREPDRWSDVDEDDRAWDLEEAGEAEPEAAAPPPGQALDGFLKDEKKAKRQEGGRVAKSPSPKQSRERGPATRSWFPETFLWQPLVVTDEGGHAEVAITVPDTLTTWRVLGVGATRDGAQAGDVYSFSSRLPVYVDPRLPPTLRAGDRIEAPVRLVNTTENSLLSLLNVTAMGMQGSAAGTVAIPAGGSALQTVTLTAGNPGLASLSATLGDADAIHKTLVVEPTGRLQRSSQSGLLGSAEVVELLTPKGAEHARVRLTLFPGPLGVVREELNGGSTSGSGGDAFRFALGADGAEVLTALGAEPNKDELEQLRRVRLEAQQALIQAEYAVSWPHERAQMLDALQRMDEDPVAERMASRLRSQLIGEQLGDGSWSVANGSTLQQLLVTTAMVTTALDDPGARVRAGAVFERHADLLLDEERGDAYTAAWVLRSGAGTAELREQLTAFVADAVRQDARGNATISIPPGVVRADGRSVPHVDVLALGSLALNDADLAASVVGAYRPGTGFGDGVSSVAALDALGSLGAQQRPDELDVVLLLDGKEVARHALRGDALLETAVLEAPAPIAGSHRYEVVSEGAWPGLAWHLDVDAWVDWSGYDGLAGLEVEVAHDGSALGEAVQVELSVSAPRNEAVTLKHSPPVGYVIDPDSVVGANVVRIDDSGIELSIGAGHTGLVEVRYAAIPTFRGSFSSGAATVALARDPAMMSAAPPQRWEVR